MFIYNMGKTMQLLSKKSYLGTATPEQDAGLQEIYHAHKSINPDVDPHALTDAFLWGYICGKRAERQRRKDARSHNKQSAQEGRTE